MTRAWRIVACATLVLGSLLALGLTTVPAGATPLLQMRVVIDGHVARDRPGEEPIRLDPRRAVPMHIVVWNRGDTGALVRHVRLEGVALGLQFLTYDVTIAQRVPAGERRTIDLSLDLYDLSSQATGYLPAAVRLYDAQRNELASQRFVVDVRGSGTSTLGLFAIALFVLAVVSIAALLVKTFRRQLPRNRSVRGLQFMLAGSAAGLTLALGLPVLRITAMQPDAWITLALGPMAIGFAIGYLAPGPLSYSIEETRADEYLDALAAQAVERRSAEQAAVPGTGTRAGATIEGEAPRPIAPATTAAPRSSSPETTAVGGARTSGPAPATTAVPVERVSGPAPATTAVPVERVSGPAPATTAVPVERVSGPAPATTAVPVERVSGPAPATTAAPAASGPGGPRPGGDELGDAPTNEDHTGVSRPDDTEAHDGTGG
jgi:hypothetical protein